MEVKNEPDDLLNQRKAGGGGKRKVKTGEGQRKSKAKQRTVKRVKKTKKEGLGMQKDVKKRPWGKKKKVNPFVTSYVPKSVERLREKANASSSLSSSSSSSRAVDTEVLPVQLTCTCHCVSNSFLDSTEQCPFLGLLNDRIHMLIVELRKAAYSGYLFVLGGVFIYLFAFLFTRKFILQESLTALVRNHQ
jgi:hypothetical protein